MITRRKFLGEFGLLAAAVVYGARSASPDSDEAVCLRTMAAAEEGRWRLRRIGDVMELTGMSFLGAPYLAHSLEAPGDEHLVVNLRAFDCTTFVESVLALSRRIRLGDSTFEGFRRELQRIRYRGGVIDGYPSRLHYFVDWIADNAEKRIVQDVTQSLGGRPYTKVIDFMSTHPEAYRQLAEADNLRRIKAREAEINSRPRYFLPRESLPPSEQGIRTGDIIGIVTPEAGIDVSHIGMAVWENNKLRFLHAPLSDGKVELSAGTLGEYLLARKGRLGVIIARPLEP
jgi:hypothetical protein